MPAVAALLEEEGIAPGELTALAVDVGPGSFTGVRIGVCHGNAMGYALGIPVAGINALEALAYPHLHKKRPVCAHIDARNGNGYGALYGAEGEALLPPCACVTEEFLARVPEDALLVGTGFPEGCFHIQALPRALDVALLGAERIARTPLGEEVRPLYLRPSQAERNKSRHSGGETMALHIRPMEKGI